MLTLCWVRPRWPITGTPDSTTGHTWGCTLRLFSSLTAWAPTCKKRTVLCSACAGDERTTLPKVVTAQRETITPAQFETLLAAIPERHRVLLLVGIETGMRWGELAALRP